MKEDDGVVNGAAHTAPNAAVAGLMAEVLGKGATFRFQASGFSMSPFIRNSDVITIAAAPAHLHPGEVAAFTHPGSDRLMVHRVVHVDRQGYLIRGDNLLEPDGYVTCANILGRVIRVERAGRRVYLGLGFECFIIAFLSWRGWLKPLLAPVRRIYHFFFEIFKS
jgi:hypothetical protein